MRNWLSFANLLDLDGFLLVVLRLAHEFAYNIRLFLRRDISIILFASFRIRIRILLACEDVVGFLLKNAQP